MVDNEVITKLLHEPDKIKREIMQLEAKEEALRYSLLVAGVSYDSDRVQTSVSDHMSAVFAEIDETERYKKLLALDYKKATDRIIICVAAWLDPSSPEATVLIMSYVGNIPMKKIAEKLNYSCSHCYYLRDRAEVLMSEKQREVNVFDGSDNPMEDEFAKYTE